MDIINEKIGNGWNPFLDMGETATIDCFRWIPAGTGNGKLIRVAGGNIWIGIRKSKGNKLCVGVLMSDFYAGSYFYARGLESFLADNLINDEEEMTDLVYTQYLYAEDFHRRQFWGKVCDFCNIRLVPMQFDMCYKCRTIWG